MTHDLDYLALDCYKNSFAHGFWADFERLLSIVTLAESPGTFLTDKLVVDTKLSKIALVVSELGEMVEGIRKPGPDQHCPAFTQEEVECADAIIRLLDYAGRFNLRLADALSAKMTYNQSRPYKHGKTA